MTAGVGWRAVLGVLSAFVLVLPEAQPVSAHPALDLQIEDLTARIRVTPDDPELYLRRGEVHRMHRDLAAAEQDFLAARRVDPDLARVDFHLARVRLEAGEPKAARKSVERFLRASPGHPEALWIRARALEDSGKIAAAARGFERALVAFEAAELARPEHYVERARVLMAAGADNIEEALAVLDRGWERLGRPVTLQLYALDLELERERYDAALGRLERISEGYARKETWLVRRGEILERAGRSEEAREAYAAAIEAIESLPPARRWNRAMLRLQQQATAAVERLGRQG